MSTISKTFEVAGVLTDMTSVTLSDITATFGVKRDDTAAVVVADGTAMTNTATGVYQYTFADPAFGLTYTYAFEVVYLGETYWVEGALVGPVANLSTYALTTMANAREYLNVASGDTVLITRLINAATDRMETYCSRKFIARDYTEWYDGTGANWIALPEYPIQTIDRVCTSGEQAMTVKCVQSDATTAQLRVTTTGITAIITGGAAASSTTTTFAGSATFSAMETSLEGNANGTWTVELANSSQTARLSSELRPTGGLHCLNAAATLEMPAEAEGDFRLDYEEGIILLPGMSGIFPRGRRNIFVAYNAGETTAPADLEQICLELVKLWYDKHTASGFFKSEKLDSYAYTVADDAGGGMSDDITSRLDAYREIEV